MNSDPVSVQDIGAVVSILIFLFATYALLTSRNVHNRHLTSAVAVRTMVLAFWFMALLRIYSATSFLWGPSLPDELWFPLRLFVLTISTSVLIILIAHAILLTRILRRE